KPPRHRRAGFTLAMR
ncbi:hypothetical protein ECTT12B_5337, partial [Escherichia coli TT12B]